MGCLKWREGGLGEILTITPSKWPRKTPDSGRPREYRSQKMPGQKTDRWVTRSGLVIVTDSQGAARLGRLSWFSREKKCKLSLPAEWFWSSDTRGVISAWRVTRCPSCVPYAESNRVAALASDSFSRTVGGVKATAIQRRHSNVRRVRLGLQVSAANFPVSRNVSRLRCEWRRMSAPVEARGGG